MFSIIKNEISSYFSSSIGVLVIGVFIIINGLFLWFLKSDYNILDYGFAELSGFFYLAPWVLLFLISAITMKSFSEEKKQGTLELLLTKPISLSELVLGKFFGSFILALIAILPSLIYLYSINQLVSENNSLDFGVVFGSYFALILLISAFTSIGIFASSLTSNQIIAFIISISLLLLFLVGFDALSKVSPSFEFFSELSFKSHYDRISRGILDSRDLLFYLFTTILFIIFTKINISK